MRRQGDPPLPLGDPLSHRLQLQQRTGKALGDLARHAVADQAEQQQQPALDQGVITSYSIHYTKLYEIPVLDTVKYFRADYLAFIRGERTPKSAKSYFAKLTAPCIDRCPAHIDIPTYIEEIKDRRPDESLATIRNYMPIPAVCAE